MLVAIVRLAGAIAYLYTTFGLYYLVAKAEVQELIYSEQVKRYKQYLKSLGIRPTRQQRRNYSRSLRIAHGLQAVFVTDNRKKKQGGQDNDSK